MQRFVVSQVKSIFMLHMGASWPISPWPISPWPMLPWSMWEWSIICFVLVEFLLVDGGDCDGIFGMEVMLFLSVSEQNSEDFQTAVWKRKKERKGEREVKRGGALEDMCSNPCTSRDHMP